MGEQQKMAAAVGLVLRKGIANSLYNGGSKSLLQQLVPSAFFAKTTTRNGSTWSPDAEYYKQFEVPILIPELNATNKWKMTPLNGRDPPFEKKIRNINLNFGPQHPAAHGVLRLVLELDGETIRRADPHVGLLHRATEKLAESKPYNQSIGYMDRLDYVSMMCNEHAYVMSIEKLLGITPPIRAQYIRVMFDEITRILNHLMWLGAHALDIGAMSMFLYAFREREDLLDCYEAVSGARMHASYCRPGGVYRDLPDTMPKYSKSKWKSEKEIKQLNKEREGSLLDFLESFCERFKQKIADYETLLTDNRIWKQRTVDIGIVSPERALQLGFTGPMLRGSGIAWDIRKKQPYEV